MAVRVLMTLLLVMFVGLVYADGVYKWVDEYGKVQYGDAPPGNKSRKQIQVAPPPPSARQETTVEKAKTIVIDTSHFGGGPSEEGLRQMEASRKAEELRRKQLEIDRENREAREREAQASSDKTLIDQCNRNREDYCGKGVDEIKRQNQDRKDTYDNTMRCATGRGGIGCPRY
jgi:hypothetical protein